MPTGQKQLLKRILAKPDAATLCKELPHCSGTDIETLVKLAVKYLSVQSAQQTLQNTCRGISRKIGEAKKLSKPIDTLLAEMQAKSAELKTLTSELKDLESALVLHATPNTISSTEASPIPIKPHSQCYSDVEYNDNISIKLLQNEYADWNHYVANNPAASVYHLVEWRDVIQQSFGHEAFYFFAIDSRHDIKGILPIIRLKSRLFGDYMVSMPYFNYGGAIADHPHIENKLIQHANKQAAVLGLDHIEYRDDSPKPDTPERTDKVNMILPLPSEQNILWQSFSPKLRSQIKRPQRENTTVIHGGMELLEDFYNIFARNMRDLGTPVYGKRFFQQILEKFPSQSNIITVKLDNKPVAAAFLLGYKETLEIPWASTIRSVNHLSINMLMYWETLCFAINNKYKYFDFGRSTIDSGTYKFKKQWGAQPRQLYWHYWLNNRDIPSLNPSNPKYKLVISIWKKLPVWLTRLVGPAIVKNLP
jgi:serine/alanine adding enzyme